MDCPALTSAPTVSKRRSALGWRSTVGAAPPKHLRGCCLVQSKPLSRQGRQTALLVVAGVRQLAPAHGATHTSTAGHEQYRAVTPCQLADELHRYATAANAAGYRPGSNDTFLATYLRELSPPHRLRRLRPRQIASVLRSLVRLGAHPGEDWLADLDFACFCHPGPFDPASATAVMQSLAELHSIAPAPSQPAGAPAPCIQWHASRGHQTRKHSSSYSSGSMWVAPSMSASPAEASSSSSAAFRFPHAVYLRLLQGGVSKYTYEQLAVLLQAFRRLGVAVDDEVALAVGSHMAGQLAGMAPGRRAAALRAVLGGTGGVSGATA